MWRVIGRDTLGEEREIEHTDFSVSRLFEESGGAMPRFDPLRLVGERLQWPELLADRLSSLVPTWLVPDDLEAWGGPEEVEFGSVLDGLAQYVRLIDAGGLTGTVVWLADSFVVFDKPEGIEEVLVLYEEDDDDETYRRESMEAAERNPSTSFVEWFAVLGTNSLFTSGDGPAGRPLRMRLGYAAGTVVGRVVHAITPGSRATSGDPLWRDRVDRLEKRHPDLARLVPRLDMTNYSRWLVDVERAAVRDECGACELVVFVHGTLSCGMRMVADVEASGAFTDMTAATVVVRYEHDTFPSVGANASQLARFVRAHWGSTFTFGTDGHKRLGRVLFIGHSRGGLVAVEAAKRLISDPTLRGPQADQIEVATYGTPHAGTPLVANVRSVGTLMRALLRVGSRMAFSSMGAEPVGWAAGWALGSARLPAGVSDMDPHGPYIENRVSEFFAHRVVAHGAEIDSSGVDDGFVPGFERGILEAVMNGEPSDGVVPTRSCIAGNVSRGHVDMACAHSDYFGHPTFSRDLRERIVHGTPLPTEES